MTAKIIPLERKVKATSLSRHLKGNTRQEPLFDNIIEKWQSESAVRSYVRWQARKCPLSDTNDNDDIWSQVEDVIAMMPSLANDVNELDGYTHAIKTVLCLKGFSNMAKTSGWLGNAFVEITSLGKLLRIKIDNNNDVRIITARLTKTGAHLTEDKHVR